eukprot:3411645-Pleurochrysis_carterae.AAC.1
MVVPSSSSPESCGDAGASPSVPSGAQRRPSFCSALSNGMTATYPSANCRPADSASGASLYGVRATGSPLARRCSAATPLPRPALSTPGSTATLIAISSVVDANCVRPGSVDLA